MLFFGKRNCQLSNLSPVWEITNVFLVFFFVGIVGFFPQTAYYYGTILLMPASIALILLAIRGSYYAFESYSSLRGHKGYAFAYGIAGLFIPAAFSVILTISEGGFVTMHDVGQGSCSSSIKIFQGGLAFRQCYS